MTVYQKKEFQRLGSSLQAIARIINDGDQLMGFNEQDLSSLNHNLEQLGRDMVVVGDGGHDNQELVGLVRTIFLPKRTLRPSDASFGSPTAALSPGFESNNSSGIFLPDERKQISLPGGYVAVPTYAIRRANQEFSQEERARAEMLSFDWEVKGTSMKLQQRCPAIWVDNFCFLYTRGMTEPELLLGLWKKDILQYGTKQTLEGLVIAGGGHYERCARKVPPQYQTVKWEQGDMSLREAADKELKEEIGIDTRAVKATQEIGYMDDVFSDPRYHGVRFPYLRWVDQAPRPSTELSNVLSIPVSQMHRLCNREISWNSPSGKRFGLILNHDIYAKLILSLPQTLRFISDIKILAERSQTQDMGRMWS